MAVSTYKHGVTWSDVPTSIVAPITADSGIPVATGVAPINLAVSPAPVNVPRIYYTFEEAVAEMGFSYDFQSYTLCEVIYTYFVLFNVGPIILINCLNPATDVKAPVSDAPFILVNGSVDTLIKGILNDSSLLVKDTAGTITYVRDVDYVAAFSETATLVVTRIPGGAIGASDNIKVTYTQIDPTMVTKQDIIGGVDATTGKGTGIQAIDDVFPILSVVPGILLTPGMAQDPEIAAILASKSDNIDGCFRCTSFVDVDSITVLKPIDVNSWKNTNNYVDHRLFCLFPRCKLGDQQYWMSTEQAALAEKTDQNNDNVPVETPSNKNLKMTGLVVGPLNAPIDSVFSKGLADMLNGQGIATAINWIGGWKAWGSNTTVYPSQSDPKDRWLPVRRMTDFVGNTLVLTIYQFVDRPGNRRLIDTIIDSVNLWLNTLVSAGQSLGCRVEFRHDENSDVELIDGHYVFHVYEAFPTPAEWIHFKLEFDVSYLETLFQTENPQTVVGA